VLCIQRLAERVIAGQYSSLGLIAEIHKINSTWGKMILNGIKTLGHEKVPIFIHVFHAFLKHTNKSFVNMSGTQGPEDASAEAAVKALQWYMEQIQE